MSSILKTDSNKLRQLIWLWSASSYFKIHKFPSNLLGKIKKGPLVWYISHVFTCVNIDYTHIRLVQEMCNHKYFIYYPSSCLAMGIIHQTRWWTPSIGKYFLNNGILSGRGGRLVKRGNLINIVKLQWARYNV